MPEPRLFPVLLAARMSLSFPLLFSAVPLWAIDHDAASGRGQSQVRRCWFSDGGLSSNFPIHLFDALVPLWPTFGIDLEDQEGALACHLPQRYEEGCHERWRPIGTGEQGPAQQVAGFFIAMVRTMQCWNDNAQARMPGVRDRVARVFLPSGVGGLNINMEADEIEDVAARGLCAARKLADRFARPLASQAEAAGWDEHRWVRLNVLLKTMRARAGGLSKALASNGPHLTNLRAVLDGFGPERAAPGYEHPFSNQDLQALRDALDQFEAGARDFPRQGREDFHAVPAPELRVRALF